MTQPGDFEAACKRIQSARPSPQDQLRLYSLFKQATRGDVVGKAPSRLDLRARAKYDAWAGHRGMSSDDARTAYIALVNELTS